MNYSGLTIRRLLGILWHRLLWLILGGAVGLAAAYFIAPYLYTQIYSSTAMVYLSATPEGYYELLERYILSEDPAGAELTSAGNILDGSKIAAGRNVASTCAVILKSNQVLEEVITTGNLELTPAQLSRFFSAAAVDNTEVLSITVVTDDPELSETLCNMLARVTKTIMTDVIEGGSAVPLGSAGAAVAQLSPSLNPLLLYALGGAGGLLVAFVVALLLVLGGKRVKGAAALTETTELNTIAVVPSFPRKCKGVANEVGRNKKALDELCAFIALSLTAEQKSILVTAADTGAGVSSLVSTLGAELGAMDKRVLVVDANMAEPSLHKRFRMPAGDGLCELLLQIAPGPRNKKPSLANDPHSTAVQWRQYIRVSEYPNLHVLINGGENGEPPPATALTPTKFDWLLSELEPHYDVILFDMPALDSSAAALMVAPMAGGVLMVARQNRTYYTALRECAQKVEHCGGQVLGTVLNAYNRRKDF